jgi:hypothetical protein
VAEKTIPPKDAASAKVPTEALGPAPAAHFRAFSLPASRAPILTSWPASIARVAIADPTMPVPRTPIFMPCPPSSCMGPAAREIPRGGVLPAG